MDISMDIHRKPVDMDMDMDGKFHIHGKPVYLCLSIDVTHRESRRNGLRYGNTFHTIRYRDVSNFFVVSSKFGDDCMGSAPTNA